MRSESNPDGKKAERSFIETARRAQIMAAAIDTIAEVGYGQASLARIAETAGTSKGVIIYHFGGKDELVRELVGEYLACQPVIGGTFLPNELWSQPPPGSSARSGAAREPTGA